MAVIFVTDGEQRAALAVVRSLGRAGRRVVVGSPVAHPLAGASRQCSAAVVLPKPIPSGVTYAKAVAEVLNDLRADVLLPITEPSLLALLPHRTLLGDVRLPFVSAAEFANVCDKRLVLQQAASVGVAVPRETAICSAQDGELVLSSWTAFPAVVKPSRSVISAGATGFMKVGVAYAADRATLGSVLHALPAQAYPVLLQERIIGPGLGMFVLMWDGELIAAFSHRRLLEKPPTGGVSVLCESMPLDEELLALSLALLERLGWRRGVAMVEFKEDCDTGARYLMEINGRFWGSLQLAIDAGVDFPAMLVSAAVGEVGKRMPNYAVGVRLRWTLGHLDHVLARLRGATTQLHGRSARIDGLRAVWDFVRYSAPPVRGEVMRWSDPAPGLRELVAWVRALS